ncbi:MAG TPA: hypothetical protein VD794_12660 [Flavisolibacter sp.]|nr:hypothetical protein [Flavisolibacter sp.]
MEWDEFREFIIGKLFLVGLSFYDSNQNLLEQYQTSGTVEELTDTGILVLRRSDDSLFAIPYDNEAISKAQPGEYTENSTGMVIKDPDYIISGDVEVTSTDNITSIKQNGFYPA